MLYSKKDFMGEELGCNDISSSSYEILNIFEKTKFPLQCISFYQNAKIIYIFCNHQQENLNWTYNWLTATLYHMFAK